MSGSASEVGVMGKVRNVHTGRVETVLDIDVGAGRWQLSCDANGRAKDVGWTADALNEHWETATAPSEPEPPR